MRDFGADSIDVVEVAMDLEDAFEVDLPVHWFDVEDPTIGEYIAVVEKAVEG